MDAAQDILFLPEVAPASDPTHAEFAALLDLLTPEQWQTVAEYIELLSR